LAVFYSYRVGSVQACETLRVGPPSLIADLGLFCASSFTWGCPIQSRHFRGSWVRRRGWYLWKGSWRAKSYGL